MDALIHPADGAFEHLAATLKTAPDGPIDHTFRIRNAKGEWVWLRARADIVQERADAPLHLVGIAVDVSGAAPCSPNRR